MGDLTRDERLRVFKGFLVASGGITLAMVLFALTGGLGYVAFATALLGIAMVVASALLWLCRQRPIVVYAMLSIGVGATVGAAAGVFVTRQLLTLFR